MNQSEGGIRTMELPATIQPASIGIPDTLLLMLLALVVFGPRRLPEIGRQIGKLMYEFRKVSNDFKYQMEEELRASEEADRQKKLQATVAASSQVTLGVAPEPASEAVPLELGVGSTVPDIEPEIAPPVDGEVRAEIQIQPPVSGVVIAAQKPFRGRTPDTSETVSESGAEPTSVVDVPVVVADEGRIGTEVQPGVEPELKSGPERETSHV
jgi:sec-independent protein translocase protein TatB